jgi:hypothetical protein
MWLRILTCRHEYLQYHETRDGVPAGPKDVILIINAWVYNLGAGPSDRTV